MPGYKSQLMILCSWFVIQTNVVAESHAVFKVKLLICDAYALAVPRYIQ
jgi:hypothetical protein